MKKTYKPLANQNKTASTFRRKTIDPKIDLGIKKDDDGLENIDDYWRVAESILEADSMSEVDTKAVEVQPEGKRFVINSLDSNVANDEMSSSVGFSMISIEEKDVNEKGVDEKGVDEEDVEEENDGNDDNELSDNEQEQSDNENDVDDVNDDEQDDLTFDDIKFSQPSKSEETTLYNIEEIKERLSHKTIPEDGTSMPNVSTLPQISNTSGFEMPVSPPPVKKPRKQKIRSMGVTMTHKSTSISEPFFIDDDVQVGLSNVSSSYSGKSELISLMRTSNSETAVLHLNPGAKILDDVAYADFTLYLKKGMLDVTIQGNTFVAKRDAILCFEKDVEYSLVNSGMRLAEAIIIYSDIE